MKPVLLAIAALRTLTAVVAMVTMLAGGTARAADVAITMDDFNLRDATRLTAQQRNASILAALGAHRIKAALFVVCQNLDADPAHGLLSDWGNAGHLIGNHTYSHPRYGRALSFAAFSADAARCDGILQGVPGFQRYFRFPTLAEGDTAAKRDLMRDWLREHRYRNGHVTIDTSDWYIDQRLRQRLAQDPDFDLRRFRDFYLQHLWARATYYNDLSKQLLGREVRHTLLIHFNLLNALYLEDVIAMFNSHGWRIVDASDAFADQVYARNPRAMPSGQSLLWSMAKESGRFEGVLRYPGEDSVYEQAEMDRLGL